MPRISSILESFVSPSFGTVYIKRILLITKGFRVNLQPKLDFLYKGKNKQISVVHLIETLQSLFVWSISV